MDNGSEKCKRYLDSLPGYVDYVVKGQPMPSVENIEEHLAECSKCTASYADLLGMVIIDDLESITDLALSRGPMQNQSSLALSLKEAELDIDVLLELSHHWLETCRGELIKDDRGTASALSAIGTLLEKKGDLEQAMEYYRSALDMALKAGNDHSRACSLNGMGQVEFLWSHFEESIALIQEAIEVEKELNDDLAQARSLLTLGDIHAEYSKLTSGLTALKYYTLSRQTAERARYSVGKTTAESRLKQHTTGLADTLQVAVKGFVERHFHSETSLFSRFCQDFTQQLVEIFSSRDDMAPQFTPARLGFGGSEVKTPTVLCAVLVAAQDVVAPKVEEMLAQGDGTDSQMILDQLNAYIAEKDTRQRLTEIGRQQGLDRAEAVNFCDYFTNLLSEKPELFIEYS